MNSLRILHAMIMVSVATIAVYLPKMAHAQESASARPPRTLYINGFRSPSIGLEYRERAFSVHSGFYTTILSQNDSRKNRSTQFLKTGATYYFNGNEAREMFFSVAHVRGFTGSWKKDGAFLEFGNRWRVAKQIDLRLGSGLLLVPGRAARLNPTPGISFALPLK